MSTRKLRAVGYVRRSTDHQDRSLGDQRDAIVKYAQEHGLELKGVYEDDAISGASSRHRDSFQRMCDDACQRPRPFDCIVVYDVKRFGRMDNDETGYYRHILRMHNVHVLYITEGFTDTFVDDLVRPVKQWQARQESKDLAKVVIRGFVSKFAAKGGGWWLSGHPPYGYDRRFEDASGNHLCIVRSMADSSKQVLDDSGNLMRILSPGERIVCVNGDRCRLVPSLPERVAIVQRIFYEVTETGFGFATIAKYLNHEGVPAPQTLQMPTHFRGPWTYSTIQMIIKNPTYAGDIVWNRRTAGVFFSIRNREAIERPLHESMRIRPNSADHWFVARDAHEPLIQRVAFEQAQEVLLRQHERKQRFSPDYCRDRADPRWKYILTGLLQCAQCKHAFCGMNIQLRYITRRKKGYRARMYCCTTCKRGKRTSCTGRFIRARVLERLVFERLLSWYGDYLRRDGKLRILRAAQDQCRHISERIGTPSRIHIEESAMRMAKGAIDFLRSLPGHLHSADVLARRFALRRCVDHIKVDLDRPAIAIFVRRLPIIGAEFTGTAWLVAHLPESPGALILGLRKSSKRNAPVYDLAGHLDGRPKHVRDLVREIRTVIKGLGPKITEMAHQQYIAFAIGRNFACMKVRDLRVLLYLKLDPSKMKNRPHNFRDVTGIGTGATGNVEFEIKSTADLMVCRPFLARAYAAVRQRGGRHFKTGATELSAI